MIAATTPTARMILKSLDRLCAQAQFAALSTLDEDGRAQVRAALTQANPRARVDITLLVASVRERISRPSAAEVQASVAARLRAIAERMDGHPPSSPAEVMALEMFPPGDEPKVGKDFPTKRRSIPRVPSRRAVDSAAGPDRADPAPAPVRRAKNAPRPVARPFSRASMPGFYAGPRLLGPGDPGRPYGASEDFDPHHEHFRPPWLIDDPGDGLDELDEEALI